jgi:hypothetical protein
VLEPARLANWNTLPYANNIRKVILIKWRIKMNIKDQLWKVADNVFKTHNPCNFNDKGECIRYQGGYRWYPEKDDTACCGGCQYLRNTGCSIKSMYCKTWLCDYIYVNRLLPEYALNALHAIRRIAQKIDCLHFREK